MSRHIRGSGYQRALGKASSPGKCKPAGAWGIEFESATRLGHRHSPSLLRTLLRVLHDRGALGLGGLAGGVARRGVPIVEHCRVAGLYRSGSTHFVATTKGTIQAGDVLMATNGYTPKDLVPEVRRQVIPIGSYMVATVPLAPDLLDRLLPGNYVYWTQRRFLNYFRRSEDDRLLFGGRPDLSPNLELRDVALGMQATIGDLFPELADVELSYAWGGRLAATFDLLPHLGRTESGIWYLVGYGGHGMTLATYLGTEVGSLIGGAQDDSPFFGLPHPTRFYYRGNPWFLQAGGVLFRNLDRVGR